MRRTLLFGAISAVLCAGCDSKGRPPPVEGRDAGGDSARPDAGPPDAGPGEPSTLFGPCVADSQCPGEGAVCRGAADGWPQGYCTVPCEDRVPCDYLDIYHHCVEQSDGGGKFCERRCVNGYDCEREGYVCVGNVDNSGTGMCTGLCGSDESCGGGAECNTYSARCVAAGTVPTTGSRLGETCDSDADCRSENCATARSAYGATGFNGGFCYGLCVLPMGYNTSTLYTNESCDEDGESNCTLPQGDCEDDAVCFPNGSFARGDMGVCWDACASDEDCRANEGFECVKQFMLPGGERTFTNGLCQPMSCMTDACPEGYECETVRTPRGTSYSCTPA